MSRIPLPNELRFNQTGHNRAELVVEPLYPGYGVTIGNALRRVLLSSLEGAAITAVKIVGVDHEFSTKPGVKEDVVDILLNLKRVRVRSYSDEPVTLKLEAKGAKEVTAGDIGKSSSVEIANPDQVIATLTDKTAKLEMELIVTKGRGYVPVEMRDKEKLDLGMIAVDAIYTPIQRVGFEVEHVRVGQMVNFDKLVMDIQTDGVITPEEAVRQTAEILLDHFQLFAVGPVEAGALVIEEEKPLAEETEEKPKKKARKTAKKK